MDKEKISRIIDLREKGMGYRAIVLETGVKRDLVRYYCKSRGLGGEIKETLKDMGVLCPQCGKPIQQPEGRGRRKKFCSEACRREFWKEHPDEAHKNEAALYHLTCECCGREFLSYGNKRRKFCSRECFIHQRFWVDLSPLQSDEYQGRSMEES